MSNETTFTTTVVRCNRCYSQCKAEKSVPFPVKCRVEGCKMYKRENKTPSGWFTPPKRKH